MLKQALFNVFRPNIHINRVACLIVFAEFLFSPFNAQAQTTTSTAVTTCNPCSSANDLLNGARTFFNGSGSVAPAGTLVFIISLNEPLAMFFRKDCPNGQTQPCTASWLSQYSGTVAQENANAATLDNLTHSRAAKQPPLVSPTNITQTDEDEIIVAWIQTQLQATGALGINAWHMLTGFASAAWYTMTNEQTGLSQQIYVGDVITVNYPGGYSEKFQFLGVHAGSVQWKRIPNTLMHNGKPVSPPTTHLATPVTGYAAILAADGYDPTAILNALANGEACYGISSVTVTSGDDTLSGYGVFDYPCSG